MKILLAAGGFGIAILCAVIVYQANTIRDLRSRLGVRQAAAATPQFILPADSNADQVIYLNNGVVVVRKSGFSTKTNLQFFQFPTNGL